MTNLLNQLGAPLAATFILGFLGACGDASPSSATSQGHDSDAEAAEEDYARGPNEGRLLKDGPFAVEMTIFETGVPPQYRIYPYKDGDPIDPASVDLTVRLHRLGDIVDTFNFTPRQDYLIGDGVVTEPHSFEVETEARFEGKTYAWRYDSFEGRTTIPDDVAANAGVVVEEAGPVKSVSANVGDAVRRGQPLARIESSSSLQEYTVTAPQSGTILERQTNAGDVAGSDPLFLIADFSQMEAYLHVFPRDAARVHTGQAVRLGVAGGETNVETTITRFLPMAGANSQTRVAVARIPADSGLQPGMRLMAEVVIAENEVPLGVKETGLQSFRDFTVVYARVGETYEVRMLDLGRRDGETVEVLGGLSPGEIYVTDNSFLIKADIDKSGASHDH